MEEFRYDTYCGLYCGACDIMAAFRKGTGEGRQAKWEDLPPELQKNIPTGKTDDIRCHGCKSDTVFVGCSKCPIRKCAKEKMQVEFCFECRKFPCLRFRIYSLMRKFMQKKLPHLRSAYCNQVFIQEKGVTTWLVQQEELWKCPQCNTNFTWYAKTCTKCGNDLEPAKNFN